MRRLRGPSGVSGAAPARRSLITRIMPAAQTMTAMEKSCAKALAQIRAKRYAEYLQNNGREKVLLYGIAFCKKKCRVMAEKL